MSQIYLCIKITDYKSSGALYRAFILNHDLFFKQVTIDISYIC
jgi:hypothetical protein